MYSVYFRQHLHIVRNYSLLLLLLLLLLYFKTPLTAVQVRLISINKN